MSSTRVLVEYLICDSHILNMYLLFFLIWISFSASIMIWWVLIHFGHGIWQAILDNSVSIFLPFVISAILFPSLWNLIFSLWYSCSTSFKAWEENSWGANWIQGIRFYKGGALHLWATIWTKYHPANCQHAHGYHWESMWTSWRRYLISHLPFTFRSFFTFLLWSVFFVDFI